MARRPRLQDACTYHVTTHAVANSWLFLEDTDYIRRLSLLTQAVVDGSMRCHAFCLMGNHEHLLITVEENRLAALMQRLNRSYAGTFNSAHHRRGRVYRAPYFAEPVVSERHLIELIRYLALNPERVDFLAEPKATAGAAIQRWSASCNLSRSSIRRRCTTWLAVARTRAALSRTWSPTARWSNAAGSSHFLNGTSSGTTFG